MNVKQGIYYGLLDRDFQKQENHIGTIKLEHDLTDNLTVANTAVYSRSKNDYLWTQPDDSKGNVAKDPGQVWRRINSRITDTETFTDQLSLAGKFNTGSLKHSFNVGAEYSKQESDKGSYITTYPGYTGTTTGGFNSNCATNDAWCTSLTNPTPHDKWLGSRTANKATTTTTTETTGIYLLDNIEINPQWLLDLGVRWDDFDTEQKTNATGAIIPSSTDFFSYQAGLTFKPLENGSIYASYATSANPVGVDAGDGSESISNNYSNLDPEESRTYEVGTKWDLFNNKLNLTAAVFRTEKQNARVQLTPTTYANVGESKVDGIELGVNGNITDKWAVSAGYTYLDSEATDNGNTCGRNATVCTLGSANNGNQMPNVAKNSATLWSTYKALPQLTLGAGATAMDKVYGDLANTKWVPGYVRYDAMARYNVNKNVDLQLNVNNLSDKRYFTKAYASHYATEAEGRSAVLSLNFKY